MCENFLIFAVRKQRITFIRFTMSAIIVFGFMKYLEARQHLSNDVIYLSIFDTIKDMGYATTSEVSQYLGLDLRLVQNAFKFFNACGYVGTSAFGAFVFTDD